MAKVFGFFDNSTCDGRLTLTSNTPVTTSDVTGATTVYFTPYKGNRIVLYDGTNWDMAMFTELSLALGTVTNNANYDVFAYNNSGTITLELSAPWTNDTTRQDALALQNGVLVKSGVATRRYLGTLRTTSTTTTEDSHAKRYIWNYYNRVERHSFQSDSAVSWTYSTASWAAANSGDADWKHEFVIGYDEDMVAATAWCTVVAGAGVARWTIGLDAATAHADSIHANCGASLNVTLSSSYRGRPGIGYHYLQAVNYVDAGTTTYYSSGATTGYGGLACTDFR